MSNNYELYFNKINFVVILYNIELTRSLRVNTLNIKLTTVAGNFVYHIDKTFKLSGHMGKTQNVCYESSNLSKRITSKKYVRFVRCDLSLPRYLLIFKAFPSIILF